MRVFGMGSTLFWRNVVNGKYELLGVISDSHDQL